MCVASMIMQHKYEQWQKRYPWTYNPVPNVILPSKEEIEEFKTLLEKAREYDKRYGEKDCELDTKKMKLLKLAEELGVDISFVEEEKPLEEK